MVIFDLRSTHLLLNLVKVSFNIWIISLQWAFLGFSAALLRRNFRERSSVIVENSPIRSPSLNLVHLSHCPRPRGSCISILSIFLVVLWWQNHHGVRSRVSIVRLHSVSSGASHLVLPNLISNILSLILGLIDLKFFFLNGLIDIDIVVGAIW